MVSMTGMSSILERLGIGLARVELKGALTRRNCLPCEKTNTPSTIEYLHSQEIRPLPDAGHRLPLLRLQLHGLDAPRCPREPDRRAGIAEPHGAAALLH